MIKKLLFCAIIGLSIEAASMNPRGELSAAIGIEDVVTSLNCDTIIAYDIYKVRVIKDNGVIRHVGLNLLSDKLKKDIDWRILEYLESSFLAQAIGINAEIYNKPHITNGRLTDFAQVGPGTPCTISHVDNRTMKISWEVDSPHNLAAELVIGYDTTHQGNRADIEETFIDDIKTSRGQRKPFEHLNLESIEPYGKNLYILPGAYYQNRHITRNIYFVSSDSTYTPVWDVQYPELSVANLFLNQSDLYGDQELRLRILKHEYGKVEEITTTVSKFMAAAEHDGCIPFWGIESFDNGQLKATLFLYNRVQSYDHVIRIECNPLEVINGEGVIKARASLFIPTNNVKNLFEPYVKKTEKEKIKYNVP